MRRAIRVVVLLGLLPIGAMRAQEPVAPGSLLRLTRCTPRCAQSTGTLLGLGQGHSSVVVHFGEELGPVEVPFDRIERIEVSRGSDSDKLAGAMLGAVAFGGVTFWSLKGAGATCNRDAGLFCGMSTSGRFASTLLATGVGAVVGVLLAPSSERWEVISPGQLNPDVSSASVVLLSLGVAVAF